MGPLPLQGSTRCTYGTDHHRPPNIQTNTNSPSRATNAVGLPGMLRDAARGDLTPGGFSALPVLWSTCWARASHNPCWRTTAYNRVIDTNLNLTHGKLVANQPNIKLHISIHTSHRLSSLILALRLLAPLVLLIELFKAQAIAIESLMLCNRFGGCRPVAFCFGVADQLHFGQF